jgi:mannose-1-phosphate guanylyltransferase
MVLAAGLGTRLRSMSAGCAKSLVPVGDRPVLAHVLGGLRDAGLERVVVNAHHRADDVRAFVRAQPDNVAVSYEPELLGTAGAVANARGLLGDGDVLVWNADVIARLDVRALVDLHARDMPEATLAVQPRERGQGPVGLDSSGRVVRLREHRFGPEEYGGEFLGVHVMGSGLRDRLPPRGGLVDGVFVPALARGAVLRAFVCGAEWHDVGTPETYLEANLAWLRLRGATSWIGPWAHVAPAVALDRSLVGAGARVDGVGALVRCVVWPGAHATAPLEDEVVTS